jgi:hypothetical protein
MKNSSSSVRQNVCIGWVASSVEQRSLKRKSRCPRTGEEKDQNLAAELAAAVAELSAALPN